jgi:hypothetical protein
MSMTTGAAPASASTTAVVTQAANTITAASAVPAGAPALSHPLFAAILALMPPIGSHWDDEDRISWHSLWDDAIDILYHQPDNDISITAAPPPPPPAAAAPAPSDGASTDGSTSTNGSTAASG